RCLCGWVTAATPLDTLSLHDALPIFEHPMRQCADEIAVATRGRRSKADIELVRGGAGERMSHLARMIDGTEPPHGRAQPCDLVERLLSAWQREQTQCAF